MNKHELILSLKGFIRKIEQCEEVISFTVNSSAEAVVLPDPDNDGHWINTYTGHDFINLNMHVFTRPK